MKQHLPLAARILVSVLFIFSAISKMFPIWLFEKQMIDLGFADWCSAPFFARLLLALELGIGIAILQKHFLKRLIIPVTILLLVVFCAHLSFEIYKHGAMNGNCGCFGQMLPMTPLEALIKNIVTIALIIYIYRNVEEKEKGKNNIIYPFAIYGFSAWLMFMAFPFCPCASETAPEEVIIEEPITPIDSITNTINAADTTTTIVAPGAAAVVEEVQPPMVKSKFAEFKNIGGKAVNLDQGKKIVCCFAPGCDHCLATATELAQMAAKGGMPEIYILFMEEEVEKIPDFLATSKIKAKYKVLDIPKFWTLMGPANTPALTYLWNGNIIYESEGTEGNAFNAETLRSKLK